MEWKVCLYGVWGEGGGVGSIAQMIQIELWSIIYYGHMRVLREINRQLFRLLHWVKGFVKEGEGNHSLTPVPFHFPFCLLRDSPFLE